ncbi:MAG: hypothetical protein R2844_08300 [Caldilineales bacterium]
MSSAATVAAQASGNGRRPFPSSRLEQSVLETFIYADIFNYPLVLDEVVRYVTVPASLDEVERVLNWCLAHGWLVGSHDYFALPGRDELIPLRERRERVAQEKWARARRYTYWLATLPFVRMVAITGTLAVNNAEAKDDIDVFVVTEPERLWLCRALVIAVVRLARLGGDELCPNYFVSERELVFHEHNYFSAREVAQMVPLYGMSTYQRVRDRNPWVGDYLPQAGGAPALQHAGPECPDSAIQLGALASGVKRASEALFGSQLGAAMDRREMQRKVRQLNREASTRGGSVEFTADVCKGHFDHHDNWILRRFQERLAPYGLTVPAGYQGNGTDPLGETLDG